MRTFDDDIEFDDLDTPSAYGEILERHRHGEPAVVTDPHGAASSVESLLDYFDVTKRRAFLRSLPYQEYLKTEHWQIVRRCALSRAWRHCERCFATKDLNVHHRTYENLGAEEDADLMVLCRTCHEKEHGL